MTTMHGRGMARRALLRAIGGVGAAMALPAPVWASVTDADEWVRKTLGGAVKDGRVQLVLKDVAESGANEPIRVLVDSPMSAADHVKSIHVVAEGNPYPHVSSWFFGPLAGKAEVGFRMRLAKSQVVRAYAVMADGSVWQTRQEIKVTIGGCGG